MQPPHTTVLRTTSEPLLQQGITNPSGFPARVLGLPWAGGRQPCTQKLIYNKSGAPL